MDETTGEYVFTLLLLELDVIEWRLRQDIIYGMPCDWVTYDNYDRARAKWTRALKKAERLGLVEQGLGQYWNATKKGVEFCKLIKETGMFAA
ncbi:MAG: hypothetical protein PHW08_00490 [Kiritimatiellae bacterium]|nr:hypothetical protein [Kiritimatiellia bacterium]